VVEPLALTVEIIIVVVAGLVVQVYPVLTLNGVEAVVGAHVLGPV
jgi:hypothetical protein